MKTAITVLTFVLTLLASFQDVKAIDFSPTNGQELQDDLDEADSNGADDTIFLTNTTYFTADTGSAFFYDTMEDNSLTIIGMGPGVSILDGGGPGGTLVLLLGSDMPNANLSLIDITLQNGDTPASGPGALNARTENADILIDNCEFKDNVGTFEGGLVAFTTDGAITFQNNVLSGNMGGFNGAATLFTTGGPIISNNNIASLNTGAFDGGITVFTDTAAIEFKNNILDTNTGGNNFSGGAAVFNDTAEIQFVNNTLMGNMGGTGGASVFNDTAKITINNNTFSGNTGSNQEGGGVFFTDVAPIEINNNTFLNNIGNNSPGGGQVFNTDGQINFINNLVAGNSSTDPTVQAGGFQILTETGTMNVINNTITENIGGDNSGGLVIINTMDAGSALIYNNIVWNNTGTPGDGEDIFVSNTVSSLTELFNNDFTEFCILNPASCDSTVLGANQGFNLIDIDPLFQNPGTDNFRLQAISPVINMGDPNAPALPTTDHDGNPRIFGSAPDLGAFEAVPGIMVDPLVIDFGQAPTDAELGRVVTITNIGNVTLVVSGMTLSDSVNYFLDTSAGANPCGTETPTLDPGDNCTIEVVFAPNAEGSFDAVLTITSNDPNKPSVQVTLSGVGISSGGCSCRLGEETTVNYSYLMLLLLVPTFLLVWKRLKIQ